MVSFKSALSSTAVDPLREALLETNVASSAGSLPPSVPPLTIGGSQLVGGVSLGIGRGGRALRLWALAVARRQLRPETTDGELGAKMFGLLLVLGASMCAGFRWACTQLLLQTLAEVRPHTSDSSPPWHVSTI